MTTFYLLNWNDHLNYLLIHQLITLLGAYNHCIVLVEALKGLG